MELLPAESILRLLPKHSRLKLICGREDKEILGRLPFGGSNTHTQIRWHLNVFSSSGILTALIQQANLLRVSRKMLT